MRAWLTRIVERGWDGATGEEVRLSAFGVLARLDPAAADAISERYMRLGARAGIDPRSLTATMVDFGVTASPQAMEAAFRGSEPPAVRFGEMMGRVAAHDDYEAIIKSSYFGRLKTLSPGGTGVERAEVWQRFVTARPWFPGSDDALYRWAWVLYRSGRSMRWRRSTPDSETAR